MTNDNAMTLEEDRPISARELEVVSWLIQNASAEGPLRQLLDGVPHLRVVGRCSCGCASVGFERNRQSPFNHPIANATAETRSGLKCGLVLWGRDDAVTGLGIYELDPGTTTELPALETLRP
jgi:hypothetical protein